MQVADTVRSLPRYDRRQSSGLPPRDTAAPVEILSVDDPSSTAVPPRMSLASIVPFSMPVSRVAP